MHEHVSTKEVFSFESLATHFTNMLNVSIAMRLLVAFQVVLICEATVTHITNGVFQMFDFTYSCVKLIGFWLINFTLKFCF